LRERIAENGIVVARNGLADERAGHAAGPVERPGDELFAHAAFAGHEDRLPGRANGFHIVENRAHIGAFRDDALKHLGMVEVVLGRLADKGAVLIAEFPELQGVGDA
jgi:hypothetical protein